VQGCGDPLPHLRRLSPGRGPDPLFALPHRQAVQWPALGFVCTLPQALRVFLRYDPRLFGQISRLIFSLIAEFYSATAARPFSTAAVVAYQSFGDALRFNPHFLSLILEGGFDSKGQFYFFPIHDTARLAQLLRQRTVGMFLQLRPSCAGGTPDF
jgi:hypothetical protein